MRGFHHAFRTGKRRVAIHLSQRSSPHILAYAWLAPPAVYLFILPYAHSIALRWIAAGLTLAIAAWQWWHAQKRGPAMPQLPCRAAIAVWIGTLLITLPWARDPALSASEFRVDVAYSLALFFAFYVLTQGEREFRIWLIALAKGSFVISLMAIASFLWYGEWVPGYHNALGEFATCMITALPAIALLALRDTPWNASPLCVRVAMAVMLIAGALTLSRMFLGALVLMMLTIAALQAWRHRLDVRQGFLVGIGIALAVAAIALIAVTGQRQLHIVEDARPAIWQVALRNIAEHPWTGSGYGRLVNQDAYALAFPDMGIRHAHNLILSVAEQSGVLAALALLALLIALAREYWRLYRSDVRAVSLIGAAGLAMLVGVAAKNMTDMFFVRECALMFWSLNGVFLGYARRAEARSSAA